MLSSAPSPASRRGPARLRRLVVVLAVLLVATALAACGDDEPPRTDEGTQPDVQGAQPSAEAATFVDEISALTLPEGATPVSAPEIGEDFASQSYTTPGFSPEQVLTFFAQDLQSGDWQATEPPMRVGRTDWQGEWTKGSRQLEISATPFGGGDDEHDARQSQFSIIVRSLD